MIKSLVRRLIPRAVFTELVTMREFLMDGWSYQRSTTPPIGKHEKLEGELLETRLTMDYHRVEKSLALPEPRRPFGLTVGPRMQTLLDEAPDSDRMRPYYQYSLDALRALENWNETGVIDETVSPRPPQTNDTLTQEQVQAFFSSRRSVRDFDPNRKPDTDLLLEAAKLATNTPSVCNRQASRLHLFTDRDEILRILSLQNGNAGFAETIPVLGVVTVRRGLFTGAGERNQRWIDGGLFAMTFVWSLHALGLNTCMLNWSMTNKATEKLRAVAGIDPAEDVIVLIAIGYGAEAHRIARSERRAVSEVVRLR